MASLASALPRRPGRLTRPQTCYETIFTPSTTLSCRQSQRTSPQIRHAAYVKRPSRPYQFTQLVQLSDGSMYTMRTTSPAALYKSQKDTRNHILWQPSDPSLRNVEVDEAGRLAAFRERFGTSFDAETVTVTTERQEEAATEGAAIGEAGMETEGRRKSAGKADEAASKAKRLEEAAAAQDSLADLIRGYAAQDDRRNLSGGRDAKIQARVDKKK